MAEVRKGKTENRVKPRTRAGTARPKVTGPDPDIRRMLAETQDQLSLIHGVLEELCERQEALAAWQMEFSKRLVSLQEAQWRSLEDLAGVDMGSPVEKAFGVQVAEGEADHGEDQLDEAEKMLEEINTQAMPKRADRMRKRRDFPRPPAVTDEFSDEESVNIDVPAKETAPDSIFVMPQKVDVH
ncbi:MAG: hypothetical protein EBR09_08450 [Proteobacteria bacterium]|nr:hypothetical protein [Pseudomonadota bacterium]